MAAIWASCWLSESAPAARPDKNAPHWCGAFFIDGGQAAYHVLSPFKKRYKLCGRIDQQIIPPCRGKRDHGVSCLIQRPSRSLPQRLSSPRAALHSIVSPRLSRNSAPVRSGTADGLKSCSKQPMRRLLCQPRIKRASSPSQDPPGHCAPPA